MATCFDRWEKDPFFLAAEEVQESTDRMESVYRRWLQERKCASNPNVSSELLCELRTTLGTAKWQLDELDRAVRANDDACSAGEETRTRHNQFFEAIGSQILTVEKSLNESHFERGESKHSWVQLDEGERDELALFLSHPLPLDKPPLTGGRRSNELPKREMKEQRLNGHRRTTSASADMEVWKISVPVDDEPPKGLMPKIPSLSCLTADFELNNKVKWTKNVFRKLKGGDQQVQDDLETIPLRNDQLSQDCDDCYERTKSCLNSCGREVYDMQLYGWFGALQRQLQRSQYQIQYGRPIQSILCVVLVVVLIIVLVAFCSI